MARPSPSLYSVVTRFAPIPTLCVVVVRLYCHYRYGKRNNGQREDYMETVFHGESVFKRVVGCLSLQRYVIALTSCRSCVIRHPHVAGTTSQIRRLDKHFSAGEDERHRTALTTHYKTSHLVLMRIFSKIIFCKMRMKEVL